MLRTNGAQEKTKTTKKEVLLFLLLLLLLPGKANIAKKLNKA